MAAFNKYNSYSAELNAGTHVWGTDTFKIAATNTAPSATDTAWSTGTYPAPAAANGYTSGGYTLSLSVSNTGGVSKVVATDVVITASGGSLGPIRYFPIFNSSKSNKVVGWYDYGSSITLADTETLTIDFDASAGLLTLS